MIRLADCIASFADPTIDGLVSSAASDIDTVAAVLGVDPNYLSVQVRIHLPRYSRVALQEEPGIAIIREVLAKLRESLAAYGEVHGRHRLANLIDSIPRGVRVKALSGELCIVDDAGTSVGQLERREVVDHIGVEIQSEMHYIHAAREDTELHAGIYLADAEHPLAYAAVSKLDREYLLNALEDAGITAAEDRNSVAVMTRAFGYNPLPKNAMSKLFEYVANRMSVAGYKYVVTALNPLLGFRGSIFSGSSFVPFATSPMRYWYNEDGSYMNRRSATTERKAQELDTPPIIWLVRALDSRRQRRVEALQGPLVEISSEAYHGR